jgi:hypothetical protein
MTEYERAIFFYQNHQEWYHLEKLVEKRDYWEKTTNF